VDAKYFVEMRFYLSHLSAYINFGFAADPADTLKWSKKPLKDERPQAVVSMGIYASDFVWSSLPFSFPLNTSGESPVVSEWGLEQGGAK
jgi:hypothetical protein